MGQRIVGEVLEVAQSEGIKQGHRETLLDGGHG